MTLSDTMTSISTVRGSSVDRATDGAAVVANINDLTAQLDALYVELGTLDLRQHCPEVASIASRLQIVRDGVQAAMTPVAP